MVDRQTTLGGRARSVPAGWIEWQPALRGKPGCDRKTPGKHDKDALATSVQAALETAESRFFADPFALLSVQAPALGGSRRIGPDLETGLQDRLVAAAPPMGIQNADGGGGNSCAGNLLVSEAGHHAHACVRV